MTGRVSQNASQMVYDVTECLLDNMNEVMSCFFRMGKTIALHVFIRWVWRRVQTKISESVASECLRNNHAMFYELNAIFRKMMVFHSVNHGSLLSVELILQDDVYRHMLRQCELAKFSDKCFDVSQFIVQAVLDSKKRLSNFRNNNQSIQTHVEKLIPDPKSFEERQALALNRAAERVGTSIRKEAPKIATQPNNSCLKISQTSHREHGSSMQSTRSVSHSSPKRIEKIPVTDQSSNKQRSWERLAELFHYSPPTDSADPSRSTVLQPNDPLRLTFHGKDNLQKVDGRTVNSSLNSHSKSLHSPIHSKTTTDYSIKCDPHFIKQAAPLVSRDRHEVPNSTRLRHPIGMCTKSSMHVGSPAEKNRRFASMKLATSIEKSADSPDEGFYSSRGSSSSSRTSLRTHSSSDEVEGCTRNDTDFGVFSTAPLIHVSSRSTEADLNRCNISVRHDKDRFVAPVGIIGAQRKRQCQKGFKMPEELPVPIEVKRFGAFHEFLLKKLNHKFLVKHVTETYGMDEQSNEMCYICQRQIFKKHLTVQCEACKSRFHLGCDSERKKCAQFWCLVCSYASPSVRNRRNTRYTHQISK